MRFFNTSLTITLCCLCSIVDAQSKQSLYQVEIVVFKHSLDTDLDELFNGERKRNKISKQAIKLEEVHYVAENEQMPQYALLPESHFKLKSIVSILEKKDDFKVISHHAWVQTLTNAKPTHLSFILPNAQSAKFDSFDGVMQISNQRPHVLHFYAQYIDNSRVDDGISYILKQSRKIKNNEVHYFDHPKIGAIISISQIEDKTS